MTMKNNSDKLINELSKAFKDKQGKASCYIFNNDVIKKLVYTIYDLFNKKRPNDEVLIVVDCYNTRKQILDYFISKDCALKYKILSHDYVNTKYNYNYKFIFTIGVNEDISILTKLNTTSKFMFSIITKNIMNNEFINKLRSILPEIKSSVDYNDIKKDNVFSPVEIYPIAISLSDEAKSLYDKYTEFISTAIAIFGDFNTIEQARVGDKMLNISSIDIRNSIARNNGWSDTLNTSIEFNKQIDNIYNPNALLEKANLVYNIIKQRKDLVTDCLSKLEVIKELIDNNPDKKILIVSKRGEYASIITKYLNGICGDYHDCIEPSCITDNNGNYIYYKTGEHKGEIKLFGSQALSNINLSLFNDNHIRCLSIKNASNSKLKTAIDLVIFTSPLCDSVIDFKYRFPDIEFNSIPNIVYNTYCENTLEQERFNKTKLHSTCTIIDTKQNDIKYKDNGDIVL